MSFPPWYREGCPCSPCETFRKEVREAAATKVPQVIESENVVCFDVDDTLVLWDKDPAAPPEDFIFVRDPFEEVDVLVQKHNPHIKLLKNHKARGKFIIVWSQGGYAWAKAVVQALGLSKSVDLIMSKPRSYVDDLPVSDWLKDRIYIKPESNWGTGLEEEKK